jgi:hypothetical protein
VPVIRAWPVVVCEYDTLHVPEARVHDAPGVKVPVLLLVNVTVPVGVIAPEPEVSATVTVHVELWPVLTEPGLHATLVEVVLNVEATVKVPLLPV